MREIPQLILAGLLGLAIAAVIWNYSDPTPQPQPKPSVDINLELKRGQVLDIEINGERKRITLNGSVLQIK